ncbi:UDP-N-acetylglucosamine/UDP-glucose/GDP-mannose transporter [Galdieria sulphuraria]|uniref:Sugar-phosphate:phosphate translocator, DMT family isoform 1 n=1 Tax=Galdieria sulphuraria TaxID=130081 RepID=M2Y1T4_GALSU|nr:sugar-phosphate:phosphate translocator, DMT family isoform 1 [Galdieria sulphuraria]EME29774.1 sugar-phosphate:phosphate translocator, DMT family isoform 1 [Galdieria sulphuraria]GJD06759.1 UDP-N-acetylglucosamine/UDP-glucose/GDP-mannose transporter [Galdieria sulphuraria]|eukprot:XP_005706294.1 sugar-phosphate:phosphate translocator, DMT family isoform 1 [Galdieria sulphuraria]
MHSDDVLVKQEETPQRRSGRFFEESAKLRSILIGDQRSLLDSSEVSLKGKEEVTRDEEETRSKIETRFSWWRNRSSKGELSTPLRKLLIAGLYAGSSLGAVLVNKSTLSQYNFNFPLCIVFLQLCFSILLLSCLHAFSVIELTPLNWNYLKALLLSSLFFVANAISGLSGLGKVNIPMFSAFRRLSVLNVMILEFLFLKKKPKGSLLRAVLMMAVGSCIAGLGDLTFNLQGYLLVFLNNFLTGANLVSIKRASRDAKLDALSLFYITSLIALPLVTLLLLLSDEIPLVYRIFLETESYRTLGFWFALFSTSTSAFAVNYFTYLCTQVNSALVTSVAGQMKNILQTLVGLLMSDYRASLLNIVGIFLALGGSVWFAYLKYLEHASRPKLGL